MVYFIEIWARGGSMTTAGGGHRKRKTFERGVGGFLRGAPLNIYPDWRGLGMQCKPKTGTNVPCPRAHVLNSLWAMYGYERLIQRSRHATGAARKASRRLQLGTVRPLAIGRARGSGAGAVRAARTVCRATIVKRVNCAPSHIFDDCASVTAGLTTPYR